LWRESDELLITTLTLGEIPARAGIVDLLDRLPDELLMLDGHGYAAFLMARAALRTIVVAASSADVRSPIGGWPRPDDQNALWAIRRLLVNCQNEPRLSSGRLALKYTLRSRWENKRCLSTQLLKVGYAIARNMTSTSPKL
jgi:hypothetical protein